MKLLLDEMYPGEPRRGAAQREHRRRHGHRARARGRSDLDVFATAVADGYVVLTENVADFARIAADHTIAGTATPAC